MRGAFALPGIDLSSPTRADSVLAEVIDSMAKQRKTTVIRGSLKRVTLKVPGTIMVGG